MSIGSIGAREIDGNSRSTSWHVCVIVIRATSRSEISFSFLPFLSFSFTNVSFLWTRGDSSRVSFYFVLLRTWFHSARIFFCLFFINFIFNLRDRTEICTFSFLSFPPFCRAYLCHVRRTYILNSPFYFYDERATFFPDKKSQGRKERRE